jgi:nucleoside-diphosphate-sugar epimerase
VLFYDAADGYFCDSFQSASTLCLRWVVSSALLSFAPAGSTRHAVADEGVPIRDIAEVIGRHLDRPLVSVSRDDAAEHFTWLAGFLAADSPASSTPTRELLGWYPTQPGLIDDLDKGHYFHKPSE